MTNLPNSHFKFFEDFFNSFVEGLFILKDFKIVFINQLAISYLKLKSHEEIIGKGLELFTPEFQPNGKNSFEYIGENIQRMSQNGHTEFEMFHQDILGELFLVHVKITVFHYEGENYQVGIWQEVQNFSKEKNIFGRSLEEVKGLIQSIDESSIISVIDRNENFTSVNKLFTEVLGYEEKEVLGKNIKMICPESEEQKFNAILTSSLNSKKIWGGEVANKKKDGSIIWFKATIVPVLDKYGEIESFITHRQDITELKLQQEENWKQLQFQANINKSTDNLIIKMRTNGMIEYINSAGEKVLGLNFIDVIDTMSPTDFFIKDEIDQKIIDLNLKFKSNVQTGLECLLYKTQRGIKNEDEWTVLSKEDKIYTIKFKIDNIYDQNQNPDGYILVGVDITERKNNEEILLKAKQTAESSLKFKNEYMARLSHEVKTPLNGILGMVDLLENTEINSEQKNYLETIQKSSFRLLGLINKTLEYEKVESGKFELHERQFSIKNEIQKIEQDFSPQCVSKNIAFKISLSFRKCSSFYN
jgi:PAS domain S-box-containing protein